MDKMYFTITGTNYYFGKDSFESGMAVKLVKEPGNAHDSEPIKVELTGPGLVGYVANSPHTILVESLGDGRFYDRISNTEEGNVLYVLPNGILCTLEKEE